MKYGPVFLMLLALAGCGANGAPVRPGVASDTVLKPDGIDVSIPTGPASGGTHV